MFKVRKCCCFDLVMAGLLIGWLGIIGSIIACFPIPNIEIVQSNSNSSNLMNNLVKYQHFISEVNSNYFKNIANIIISACLIYGTMQRKRCFLLPWLITTGILVFVFTIFLSMMVVAGTIVAIAAFRSPNSSRSFEELSTNDLSGTVIFMISVIFAIIIIITYAMSVYLWIVIYSLYDYIQKGEQSNGCVVAVGDVEDGETQLVPLNK